MVERKRIRLVATGGTISSVSVEGRREVTPTLAGADLLESVPQLREVGDIEVQELPPKASTALTIVDMHAIAKEVARALEEGCDGVVVSHGTGTLEETAYALALMLPRSRPIVLTGAMRDPGQPGSDAPANLLAAFRVAASTKAEGLGPLAVLNDELHAARWVTKLHTSRVSTFASPGAGPIGEVVEGRVHVWWRPAYEDYVGFPDSIGDVKVELVRVVAGAEEALLHAAVDLAPAGIVVEALGPGVVPPEVLPAIDAAAAAGIVVVVASRCVGGRNFERTYSFPGSETDLAARGALPAGALLGHKARLRLLVGKALARSTESLFPVE